MNKMNAVPIDELILKWDESYKKGLLSFWMLMQLQERPSYAFEMNKLIQDLSKGTISAEDNSIYRALNRFEGLEIVSSKLQPSDHGPDRRYYQLTEKGFALLQLFIQRNLMVFQDPGMVKRFVNILNGDLERKQ